MPITTRDNAGRATAAQAALDTYTATNLPGYLNESTFDRAADLMCDLLHLLDENGYTSDDLDNITKRARSNFDEELNDETQGATYSDDDDDDTPATMNIWQTINGPAARPILDGMNDDDKE